jgi:hypothetical protein
MKPEVVAAAILAHPLFTEAKEEVLRTLRALRDARDPREYRQADAAYQAAYRRMRAVEHLIAPRNPWGRA